MTTTKWDVFVSHSSKDKPITGKIVSDLRKKGLNLWYDETAITPGKRLRIAINEGIRNSKMVLIFISVNSLKSQWVLNELDAAMLREITEKRTIVIPVLIGRVKIDQIPEDLKGKKFIDLRYNFSKRYEKQQSMLIQFIMLASNSSEDPFEKIIEVSPENLSFFNEYDFKWRHEEYKIPLDIIDILAVGLWKNH